MLSYEVLLNGQNIAVAGMEDWAVMSVIVSATREDDAHGIPGDHTLHIGGMTRDTAEGNYHTRWNGADLVVGSEILIRVIESDNPDPPKSRYRYEDGQMESPFTDEEARELRYQTYLELKGEFES